MNEIAEVAETLASVIRDEHREELPHEMTPEKMDRVVTFLSKIRTNMRSSSGLDHLLTEGFVVSMGEMVRPSATLFAMQQLDDDLDPLYSSHLVSLFATLCASTALLMHAVEFEKWPWTNSQERIAEETAACVVHCRTMIRALFDEDDQVLVNAWKDAQASLKEMTTEENDEWMTRYVSSMSQETTERSGK